MRDTWYVALYCFSLVFLPIGACSKGIVTGADQDHPGDSDPPPPPDDACNTWVEPQNIYYVDQQHAQASDSNPGTEALPYLTITGALVGKGPDDAIVVKAGTYRESPRLVSGDATHGFKLMAAPGEEVIISGMRLLSGWTQQSANVWMTNIDWRPEQLFVAKQRQPIAKSPNEGWWVADSVQNPDTNPDPDLIEGTISSSQFASFGAETLAGSELFITTRIAAMDWLFPVVSLDSAAQTVTIDMSSENSAILTGSDNPGSYRVADIFWLQNHPGLIDLPGEWAVAEAGAGTYNVYFYPADVADLQQVQAPYEPSRVVYGSHIENVRLEGLEITGSNHIGLEINNASRICVTQCSIYSMGYIAVTFSRVDDVTARRNLVYKSRYGLAASYTTNSRIEENEIGYNDVDGLLVTWQSDNVVVRRNYIHHHVKWQHPDNIQLYQGVTNIQIADNLLVGGGQSIMMQETSGGVIEGNAIVGSLAYSLIFGHASASDYAIHNNTIALTGYGALALSAHDYDIQRNVVVKGNIGRVFSVVGISGYTGDYNLLFNADIATAAILDSEGGAVQTLEDFRASTGQEQHSVYADPQFVNAPRYFALVGLYDVHQSTRSRLYLESGTTGFNINDNVEIDFDGVPRTITALDADSITISPELAASPLRFTFVADWGNNDNLDLDLRLSSSSPDVGGETVGATLDFPAFLRADFDSDGVRDVPALPF